MNFRDLTLKYLPTLNRKLSINNLKRNYLETSAEHLLVDLINPYLVKRIKYKELNNKHINYLVDIANQYDNVFFVSIIEHLVNNVTKEEFYYLLDKLPHLLRVSIIEYNNYWFKTKL